MDIYNVFEQAKELGVSTFKFGNSLIEETIFNFLLQKVELIVDTQHNITAYVTISNNNIQLVINPEYLYEMLEDILETEPTETQLLAFYRGILKHELLHCALNHLIRDPKRSSQKLSNIVMDALINREIQEFKYLNIPRVTPEELILVGTNEGLLFPSEKGEGLTWEQYYDFLVQFIKDKEKENGNKEDKEGNEDCDIESKLINNIADYQGYTQQHSGTITEGDLKQVTENELPPVIEKIVEEINRSIDEFCKSRGTMFSNMIEKLRIKRSKPIVKWEQILRQFIKQGNCILSKDYSYKRRDRRTGLPPGGKYMLKGGSVYILIDSSGSISDKELQIFGSEIYQLVKKYQMYYKIWTYSTNISNPVDIHELKRGNLEISTRGGTDLCNVLKELREQKVKPPDMWIILTDAYDRIPEPKEFVKGKILFLLSEDYSETSFKDIENYKYKYTVLKGSDRMR